MSLKLHVIIASTRPGRVGPKVADWFAGVVRQHGQFEVELVDLAQFELPVYNEANHPRTQQYEHDHTRQWSESVSSADAFIFVTPEYNYGPTPALVNALNYVYREWNYKPCGFVSYGGLSGGMRGVEIAKQLANTLKMVPMVEGVALPMVWNQINEDGVFAANELNENAATTLLDELHRWAGALQPMRA